MEAAHARDCLPVCLYVETPIAGMTRSHKKYRAEITIDFIYEWC